MQRDLRKKVLRELEMLAAQEKDPERAGLLLAAHNALVTAVPKDAPGPK